MGEKITSFTDLNAWRESHALVLEIYSLTKSFPKEEVFGLVGQMRRSAVSITSNIAEGFSRGSHKDKIHFYRMTVGSLTELQNQLLIGRDIGYTDTIKFSELAEKTVVVSKLINGLIKSISSRIL